MKLRTFPGRLVVSRAPMIEKVGRILLPGTAHKLAVTAYVHLHEESRLWGDVNLKGRTIFIEKYAWRNFRIRGTEFSVIPEGAVLGVRKRKMKRDTFIVELVNIVQDQVETNKDLTQQDIEAISERLDTAVEDIDVSEPEETASER